MPDRKIAGRARRLVVAADHPRRPDGNSPLQRISEEPRPGKKHPDGAATRSGRPRHPEDGARLRRQPLSGICADTEGARGFSGADCAAAVEREIFHSPRWVRDAAGGSRKRPAGTEARTARSRRPVAGRRGYGVEAKSRDQAPPAPLGLREAEGSPGSLAPSGNYLYTVYYLHILFLRAPLEDEFYNFFDAKSAPLSAPSTSVDLTGAPSPPMFAAKRPTRISRNRPLFFP